MERNRAVDVSAEVGTEPAGIFVDDLVWGEDRKIGCLGRYS